MVLIPDSNTAEHAGRLVRADRSGKRADSPAFAVRADGFTVPDGIPFERVVVSEDGRRVAAASDADKDPFVCVWETKEGRLTHWITPDRLEDAVLALAFSSDGRYLLTGGDSPAARLWDLSGTPGRARRAGGHLRGPLGDGEYHLRRDPARARRAGRHRPQQRPGPRLEVASRAAQAALDVPRLVAREFATAVKALCFTSDGRYLGGVRRRQADLGRRHGTAAAPGRRAGQASVSITTSRSTP